MTIYLDSENISKGGSVEFITCVGCSYKSFKLQLSSDTDMVYVGVIGFVSATKKELVLTNMTTEEFKNYMNWSGEQLASRLNKVFCRTDLEFYKSRQFEKEGKKIWAAECPKCNHPFEVIRKINFEEFIEEGGKIITYSYYDRK